MTAKKIPSNLEQLLKQPEYVEVDSNFTSKGLQDALRELGEPFRSNESKGELVWRYVQATQDSKPSEGDVVSPEAETETKTETKTETETETEAEAGEQKEPKAKEKTEDKETKDEEKEPEFEQITVYNDGAYNLYEPHSRTLFYAYKEAVIVFKPSVDKERVLANIKQINATRGKVLLVK